MLAAALFGLATLPGIVSAQESGQEQGKQVGPPGFDYWQPEWMTRELWGPGRMPKSMMARLLRHTTYVNFGVEKEYEGAQSPFTGKAEAIAQGRSSIRRTAPLAMDRMASATATWARHFLPRRRCSPT